MPLVVITGPPSTGKSRRATELAELLSQRPRGRVEKTRTLAGRGVLDKDHVKGDGRFNSFRKNKEVKEIKKEEVDKDSKDLNGLESGVAELKIEASSAAPSSAPTEEKPKDTWTVNIVNEESIKADRQSAYKSGSPTSLFIST